MKNMTDFRKTVETGVDPRLTRSYFSNSENLLIQALKGP